ncbi:hypothetical protein V8E54_007004 [Elaphomyces granulatus]
MDMGTLLVIFLFYVRVVHASAFHQAENELVPRSPITTAPPKLDDRDVSSLCGFYYDSVTAIMTWTCNSGLPCVIDRYVTPNIIFCSVDALIPFTKYYSYGGWPQSGCGIGEYCCPSANPKIATLIYDSGASYYYQCDTRDAYTRQPLSLFTQLQDYSIYLPPYTTINVATTSTTAAPQGVALIPSTTTSLGSVTSAASSTTTPFPQSAVPQTLSSNNTNPKVALAAGLGAGIPIVLAAGISLIIFLMRRSKKARTQNAYPTVSYHQNELNGKPIGPWAPPGFMPGSQPPPMHELNSNSMNGPSTPDTQKRASADGQEQDLSQQHLAELDGR